MLFCDLVPCILAEILNAHWPEARLPEAEVPAVAASTHRLAQLVYAVLRKVVHIPDARAVDAFVHWHTEVYNLFDDPCGRRVVSRTRDLGLCQSMTTVSQNTARKRRLPRLRLQMPWHVPRCLTGSVLKRKVLQS